MDMLLSDYSVDNFVSATLLEHMPDPWKAINEINKIIKPAGNCF